MENEVEVSDNETNHDERAKRMGFTELIVKRPCTVMAVSAGLVVILGVIAFTVVDFNLSNTGNFYVRRDKVAELEDAFKAAQEGATTESASLAQQSELYSSILIYYLPKTNQNLLDSVDSVIKTVETRIITAANYDQYCLRSYNGSQYSCLAPFSIAFDEKYKEILADYPNSVPEHIADILNSNNMSVLADKAKFSFYMDKKFDSLNLKPSVMRSFIRFGLPLAGYDNMGQAKLGEQRLKMIELMRPMYNVRKDLLKSVNEFKDKVEILYMGDTIFDLDIEQVIGPDMGMFGVAIFAVLFVMILNTWSWTLSSLGMLHTLLSFLGAYFFFRIVTGFEWMTQWNLLALFIVLAVGADDVFVFVDAWKQSAYEGPAVSGTVQGRLAWSWRRSANCMLITSLTTAAAFLASVISTIPTIRTLGIFTAYCVIVNYLLVITWFPAVVVWWHQKGYDKTCCRKPQDLENVEVIKMDNLKKVVDNGATVGKDLTVAAEQVSEIDIEKAKEKAKKLEGVKQYRIMERFFHYKYAPFALKFRYVILVLFLAMLVVFSIFAARIEPMQRESGYSWLPPDHMVNKILVIQAEDFRKTAEDSVNRINVVWGLTGIDRVGIDDNDEFKVGTPIYESSTEFDMSLQSAQSAALLTCQIMGNRTDLVEGGVKGMRCPWTAFNSWLDTNIKYNTSLPISSASFGSVLEEFLISDDGSDYAKMVRLVEGKVKFAFAYFNSTMDLLPSLAEMQSDYAKWNSIMVERNTATKNTGVGTPYQTSSSWVWMKTSETLVQVALYGCVGSLLLAFIVFCASAHNIILAFYALFSIAGVIACVLGVFVMAGWRLNLSESMGVTVIVGLSVDYIVHLAIAYSESKSKTRFACTRDALTELGVSIVGGASTSLSASFFLLFTTMLLLQRFGMIILMTIGFSFLWANGFFVSLLLIAGPMGKQGDLKVFGRVFKKFKKSG